MDQVRYGIIGYGKIGSQHVKKILEGKVPSLKICAIADTDPKRMEAAKEALGDLAETEEDIMSYICFPAQAEKFLKDRKANREKVVKYTIEEA